MMLDIQKKRHTLVEELKSVFIHDEKRCPEVFLSTSGRVNLIGEHIDHQGYDVLPATLSQGLVFVGGWVPNAPGSTQCISLKAFKNGYVDLEEKVVQLETFSLKTTPCWVDYISCGFWGAILLICQEDLGSLPHRLRRGENVLVCKWLKTAKTLFDEKSGFSVALYLASNLPAAAGLSSSSALVVGALLSFLQLFGSWASREDVASTAALVETWLGTSGGGMDQAAICFGKAHTAQKIQFHPLRAETVVLPQDLVVVLCHSGEQAVKTSTAPIHYNKRIFELLLASFLMLWHANLWCENDEATLPKLTLKEVQKRLLVNSCEAVTHLEKSVSPLPYSKEDIVAIMGESRVHKILKERVGFPVWEKNVLFEPYRRALHVLKEAERVHQFIQICKDTSPLLSSEEKIKSLSRIIDESDRSLTLLYDNKTPRLDQIITSARRLGAYGSRVVGAGWGGCTLSLVLRQDAELFIQKIKEELSLLVTRDPSATTTLRETEMPQVFLGELDQGTVLYTPCLAPKEWL